MKKQIGDTVRVHHATYLEAREQWEQLKALGVKVGGFGHNPKIKQDPHYFEFTWCREAQSFFAGVSPVEKTL